MNKAQKEVQQAQLNDEKKVIKLLERVYEQAKKDCEQEIRELSARTDLENLQSIIYQKEYQEAIKKQLDGILDTLHTNQFTGIAEYLQESYNNGFIGTMYDLRSQGIPLIIPIRQEQVVKAVQTDSKISNNLYTKLGEDTNYLKRSIRAELSRGIANGSTWNEMAAHIAKGMNSPFRKAYNNAIRIARTEGHRIQNEAALDGQRGAKKKGADVVKQWDSTLDGRTRDEHRECDGQIREIDEPFDVGGEKMQAPGVGGSARNVCNCRCCLLQRAKWVLDEDELKTLQDRASFFGLDKSKSFDDFKQKYLKLPDNADTMNVKTNLPNLDKLTDPVLKSFVSKLDTMGVEYREVKTREVHLSTADIINVISGGDQTDGSCASVALAYIGQLGGVDVLDFRDGRSREYFSTTMNLKALSKLPNVVMHEYNKYSSSVANGFNLLQMCEQGKEYYFCNGLHASIVRRTGKGKEDFEYLELQSAASNGWKAMHEESNGERWSTTRTVRDTLRERFRETKNDNFFERTFMLEVDSLKDSDELKKLLGYINTAIDAQRKGKHGTIK